MQLFLNERSLENQYSSEFEFRRGITQLFDCADVIQTAFDACEGLYAADLLYVYAAFSEKSFFDALEAINDQSFKRSAKRILYERLNLVDWRAEPVQDRNAAYICFGADESGTSIAESAERSLQEPARARILLNFCPSRFNNISSVRVTKNTEFSVNVDCAETIEAVASFLNRLKKTSRSYDPDSDVPPRDEETILLNALQYKRTPYIVQGRRVYQHRETKNRVYVDQLHHGNAAHLEVFGRLGPHLGTADLDGTLQLGTAIAGRVFEPN